MLRIFILAILIMAGPARSQEIPQDVTAMIGQPLLAIPAEGAEMASAEVATIKDVQLQPDGAAPMVILSVGGFLGIGDKSIVIPLDRIRTVTDVAGTPAFAIETTPEELHNLPLYEEPTE